MFMIFMELAETALGSGTCGGTLGIFESGQPLRRMMASNRGSNGKEGFMMSPGGRIQPKSDHRTAPVDRPACCSNSRCAPTAGAGASCSWLAGQGWPRCPCIVKTHSGFQVVAMARSALPAIAGLALKQPWRDSMQRQRPVLQRGVCLLFEGKP